MNDSNRHDELSWLAFQYVAGDFSTADAEAFEERLATDQAAREAVAEAVALFHAVCEAEAAEPAVAVAKRTAWSPSFVWRTVVAIAAAVLLAGTLNLNPFNQRSQGGASVPALANAWTSVRENFAGEENPSASVSGSAVLTEAELAVAEEDLAFSTEAPSWMTAAVAGLAGKTPLDSGEVAPQENSVQ